MRAGQARGASGQAQGAAHPWLQTPGPLHTLRGTHSTLAAGTLQRGQARETGAQEMKSMSSRAMQYSRIALSTLGMPSLPWRRRWEARGAWVGGRDGTRHRPQQADDSSCSTALPSDAPRAPATDAVRTCCTRSPASVRLPPRAATTKTKACRRPRPAGTQQPTHPPAAPGRPPACGAAPAGRTGAARCGRTPGRRWTACACAARPAGAAACPGCCCCPARR